MTSLQNPTRKHKNLHETAISSVSGHQQKKKLTRYNSSPFPACFRPQPPLPATQPTTQPNLTTSLYQTNIGLVSLTWSRAFLARDLHIHLHPNSSFSFHLTLKPYVFWSKNGVKKLVNGDNNETLYVFWDFTNARFGAGSPEPESGYYIAVVEGSSVVLFVGDLDKGFYSRLKSHCKKMVAVSPCETAVRTHQSLVVRREHVCGSQFYTTNIDLAGKTRVVLIEVNKSNEDDPRLVIRVDNKRVIQVKHLKWKFRGSERFDVDGHQIQLSWDVYNWLFDEDTAQDEQYALFTFRLEQEWKERFNSEKRHKSYDESIINGGVMWSQDSCGLSYERKKMKKKLLVKTSSSSSSSLSSTSSSGSSSIMEWESVEENELKAPTGFSLLVYAWKS